MRYMNLSCSLWKDLSIFVFTLFWGDVVVLWDPNQKKDHHTLLGKCAYQYLYPWLLCPVKSVPLLPRFISGTYTPLKEKHTQVQESNSFPDSTGTKLRISHNFVSYRVLFAFYTHMHTHPT